MSAWHSLDRLYISFRKELYKRGERMGSQSSSEVRKRIAERRKNRERMMNASKRNERPTWPEMEDEKEWGSENVFVYEEGVSEHKKPPIVNKDWILFRILASVCLVLCMAIIYRTSAPWTQTAKTTLDQVYQKEFQFASVSSWFEDTVGKPFAFLPEESVNESKNNNAADNRFATPATGTIMKSFVKDGQGVLIKTSNSTSVDTIKEGVVIYAGEKETHGKTVIVQHPDKSESWYAHLQEINVNLYEQIKKGTKVGIVSPSDEPDKGEFYFALKANGKFIDPNEVISFE